MAELRAGAATHPGRVRRENEDSVLSGDGVFVVADGMGGHEAGEVASRLAIERIAERLDDEHVPNADEVVEAITTANGDIFRAAIANPSQRGMGTTVTAIVVIADPMAGRGAPNIDENDPAATASDPEQEPPGDVTPITPADTPEALVLANVGDSRTYLFRHDRLRRVTVDHSYVQELVSTGHITEDEARHHPRRNIITRALGIEPDVRVDWWTLPLIRGDRFVLCSDGLVDEVSDAEITSTLVLTEDPQEAAERLVEQALDAGGRDNVTVIVLDVLDGDEPPDPTQEIDIVPRWADDAADPTPAGPLEVDADPNGVTEQAGEPADGTTAIPSPGKRRISPLRALAAVGTAAAIVVILVFVAVWARSGYFIEFDSDGDAVVYRGQPDGVLFIDPTVEAVGPTRDAMSSEAVAEIETRPEFDSFQEAFDFLNSATTTTTTTTSTTTTVPPTTVPPTTAPATTVAGPAPPTGTTTG